MMPDGLAMVVAWSPKADAKQASDKGSTSNYTSMGSGYDVTATITDAMHGVTGLTAYLGYSHMDQMQDNNDYDDDKEEQTWAINYAMGGFTVGYQWSEEDLGLSTGAQSYENTGYGITFAVNDDLSIGYNNYESEQDNSTDVTAEASSFQIAYSMGGASIRLATASIDNASYQTTAMYDKDATTLSISLAF